MGTKNLEILMKDTDNMDKIYEFFNICHEYQYETISNIFEKYCIEFYSKLIKQKFIELLKITNMFSLQELQKTIAKKHRTVSKLNISELDIDTILILVTILKNEDKIKFMHRWI